MENIRTVTKTFNVYRFSALPEIAQRHVLIRLSDINVDHCWYDYTIEDARNIEFIIKEFDIDRGTISAHLEYNGYRTAKLILENHGATCITYKLAIAYMHDSAHIMNSDMGGHLKNEMLETLEINFERQLKDEYINMLNKEQTFLMSEQAIIDTINANDYEFTIDGNIYSE